MSRPLIYIVNSSTFGKHFKDHIDTLESFAELKRIDFPADIDGEALGEKIKDADGIIASVTPKFTKETLRQCDQLILLSRHGRGCDNVDVRSATELGIQVSRVKGDVEREGVAEYAVSLLMSATRKVTQGLLAVRDSQWAERYRMVGMEIKNKTIGIIGLGNIGSRSAEILSNGFGAEIVAVDPYISQERFEQYNARQVSLDELLEISDAVLFHCPLTDETERMLGQKEFNRMKKGAVLVNTCRGELIDEDALYAALQAGQLGFYATDVVEDEPIDGNHRLVKMDNVIITPHLGGYSWESLHGMGQTCVDDMVSVFRKNSIAGELANPDVLNKEYRKWH